MDDGLHYRSEEGQRPPPPGGHPERQALHPYAFRRSHRTLQQLSESFADGLAGALSRHLRAAVQVCAHAVEQITYQEFLLTLEPRSCIGVLRIDPPGAQACIDFPPQVIAPIIAHLMGGGGFGAEGAALTEIERGVALQIIERAAAELSASLSRAAGEEVVVREEAIESTPQSLRLMPADELIAVARFELSCGSGPAFAGTARLCMPQVLVRQLLEGELTLRPQPRDDSGAEPGQMRRNMLQAAVELRAVLAETKARLSDVLAMQVGDVITTEKAVGEAVELRVDGEPAVSGQLGQLSGRRAVRINHPSASNSPQPASTEGGPA